MERLKRFLDLLRKQGYSCTPMWQVLDTGRKKTIILYRLTDNESGKFIQVMFVADQQIGGFESFIEQTSNDMGECASEMMDLINASQP